MKAFLKDIRKNYPFLLMVIPGFIWFTVFCYIPMFGAIIAFKDLKLTGKGFLNSLLTSEWVGFKNFEFLFKTSDAWIITRNTIGYNLIFIVLGLFASVTLAILFTEISRKKLSKIFQSSMFLPHFLSWVVVSYFVFAFLNDTGLFNNMLIKFGMEPRSWYLDPTAWPIILIVVNLWKTAGYSSVVYIATIAGIDSSYYEAAMIDGATKVQQIKYITLPMLKPVMIMLTLLSLGKIFNSDFGLFYQVPRNSGVLYPVTNVIDTYVYRSLTTLGDFGMSAAAGLYQSVVGCILIIVSNKVVNKIDSENALF